MGKGFGSGKVKNAKQSHEDCNNFLLKITWECANTQGNTQVIYPLLQANLDKLDDNFANLLYQWAFPRLYQVEPGKAQILAAAIVVFSKLIQDFPLGSKANNLEIAIAGYEVVTTVFTRDAFPEEWAQIQNNMGIAFLYRIRGNRLENLETALCCFEAALQVRNYSALPERWAETKTNQGIAFFHRIRQDRAANIEKAIRNYEDALQIYTRDHFPEEWATIQHNLGIALNKRIHGNQAENQEQAIAAFVNALQVRIPFTKQWADTQNCLGLVYWKRIQGDKAENIELAITAYQQALQVHTRPVYPERWADLQEHQGLAYCERIHGNKPDNLDCAIASFNNALQVFTQFEYPYKWAITHSDMGVPYFHQGLIDEAIICFQLALTIHTHTADPFECYKSACNLGNVTFIARRWTQAIEGYRLAIEAVETSRTWAHSESRRQEILEESVGIYQNMVQACINAGQIEKAFEYSERSRSKRLVDLMASYNLSQGEDIPPKVQELLQQYEELQQQIDQERQSHKSENNRNETRAAWEAYNEAIASLETQKQQVWENLRREDPVLAGEIQVNPLSLSEIQKLIDQPNTAILSFYTTNSDTHIFVVQQNKITLHTCIGQGLDTLQGWINQNWLLPYMNDSQKWETQINSILRELAERLQISQLISEHLQGIEEIIVVPHLLLHQIPFAALPTGEYQEYLGDKFLIRYTPSCQILEFCQQRDNVGTFNEISLQYGTVEDAEDNLPCARFEGDKLAQMYNIPPENRLIGSIQATAKNYRQLAQKVQVLHSCHHAQSRLDNPLESQLKLAGGSITLGQLMTPSWRLPQLLEVFLSCCETNLGTPSLTDDILTLSTGFLCAGARSVVSSLWAVDDLATAVFSIFYYQLRQQGKSRPEAMRQAQIKLRTLRKEDFKEMFRDAETREKSLIRMRKQYNPGSVEYLEWEREYKMYAGINRKIKEMENSTEELPFLHPRYWAAFICQGLR
ncbi:CHAT domain-containing protein [Calothrix sp. PCC 7507]|uniref:CHAT domain-containing protein n=1 Tax=Calothrix sp. PCC 7507 TaxID=99598 RepID=UPI00029F018F|nr:CHAT domain-containing tetratricopeptide repeat protein [Calothrix sp. PCC 7507]AFY33311.1 TPR repeat-containing protein [Calothrix sp. PCC 7507]